MIEVYDSDIPYPPPPPTPLLLSGNGHKLLRRDINLLVAHLNSLRHICPNINRSFEEGGCHAQR